MKAADLIGVVEFDAFISYWIRDKRCPLAFVDYLLEQGLESQADIARWAATREDRKQFESSYMNDNNIQYISGPFPCETRKNLYYWFNYEYPNSHANCVPASFGMSSYTIGEPLIDCLIYLLDERGFFAPYIINSG